MLKPIKQWYQGKTVVHEFESNPVEGIYVYPLVYQEYHWSAKAVRTIVGFCREHWQWLIGTVLAVIAIIVSM